MHEKKGLRIFGVLGRLIIGIIMAAVFSLIVGALVMILWNWLMPGLFGLGIITYWQAFGLALLAKLLFGAFLGFGKPFAHPGKRRHAFMKHKGPLIRRFDDTYEEWWEKQGEKSFEEYMKTHTEKEE